MTGKHESHDNHQDSPIAKWVFIGFLAIAGFFLITEHRAHLFGVLPWLLILACPFMHFFMHGDHGGHGSGDSSQEHQGHSEKGGKS